MTKQTKRIISKLTFSVLLFALLWLAADTAMFFTTDARMEWKKFFGPNYSAYLYLKPAYIKKHCPQLPQMPFDRIGDELKRLKIPSDKAFIVYCDEDSRRYGFYPNRKKEAFLLGDSFTYGEGVGDRQTLGYFLGQEFTDYNFKNFAWPGRKLHEISRDLLNFMPMMKQNAAVFYFYNLNDASTDIVIDTKTQGLATDFENISYKSFAPSSLLAKSTLANLLVRLTGLWKESAKTTNRYLEDYLDSKNAKRLAATLGTLKQMDERCRKTGRKFILVIYPLMHKNIWGRYPFEPIHEKISRFCRDNNITCVDGAKAFENDYSMRKYVVNPADYHPNAAANKKLCAYIARNISLD